MLQTTVAQSVELAGVGLHTGAERRVRLSPTGADTGLVFRRSDLPARPELLPGDLVKGGPRGRTALCRGAAELHTIEHLAAAALGLGCDNLLVEVDGDELPALDGSALGWVEAIGRAGLAQLDRPRRVLRPASVLTVEQPPIDPGSPGASISIVPVSANSGFRITYVLDYPDAPLAQGEESFAVTPESFAAEIAPARTFCMAGEVEALRAASFGRGASAENTLVVDGDRLVNPEGGEPPALRFPDEPLRHKVLDLVGDMALLLPRRLEAHIYAQRSGHRLNCALLQKIVEDAGARAPRPGSARRQEARTGTRPGHAAARPPGFGKEEKAMPLDIREIQEILPHRYPFLLVDRVLDCTEGQRIVALKNVSANESFFQGHFPGDPIMPGVLQVEAMAQTAGLLMMRGLEDKSKLAVLMSLDKVKLRRPVVPGDQLVLEADSLRLRGNVGEVRTRARVDGQVVAQAEIRFAMVDRSQAGEPRKAGKDG